MIYLDNSATTRVNPAAAKKAAFVMEECFGNPSSMHSLGFWAERELDVARERVAAAMGVSEGEVIFTSGGTEGNNFALFGAAYARKRFGKRIVTSSIEHPSVLRAVEALEREGFHAEYLCPGRDGTISPQQVREAITADTVLVSLMSVNNETGALLPLNAVSPAIKRSGSRALFHVDHVQGFGKLPLNIKKLGIDLMTVSGHKVHGPKGTGALYLGKGLYLAPRILGGGQERGLRSGTENLPGIAAFGEALQAKEDAAYILGLNRLLRTGIGEIPGAAVNSPADASPYILNFTPGKVKGETLLHFLSEQGIYISTGSACTGGSPSHVLLAMGLAREQVECSLRVSFCSENTPADVGELLRVLKEGLQTLKTK